MPYLYGEMARPRHGIVMPVRAGMTSAAQSRRM
jgi:hypothetical protein